MIARLAVALLCIVSAPPDADIMHEAWATIVFGQRCAPPRCQAAVLDQAVGTCTEAACAYYGPGVGDPCLHMFGTPDPQPGEVVYETFTW